MYDMTPLTGYEVTGPGRWRFLQRMTTNNVDKSVGSVTYTLLLDETGGVRSDLTVARLGDTGSRSAPTGRWTGLAEPGTCPTTSVQMRDITGGTCCIGVWGPLARDLVAAAAPRRLLARGFGYFRALQTFSAPSRSP